MRMFLLIALLTARPCTAQTYVPGQILSVQSTLPATCNPPELLLRTATAIGFYVCTATNTWTVLDGSGGGGVPAGSIILIDTGTCPDGFAEATALSGKTIIGTVAANGDVGTTGGSDTITPAGTVAWPAGVPTISGIAVADHASHTHTYTDVVNHVHTLATGTGSTGNFSQVIGTVDTSSGGTGATPTQTTLGTRSVATVGGVATGTTAGPSITLSHTVSNQGSIAWPVGVPLFTGTQFDNRSAWVKLIACKKT